MKITNEEVLPPTFVKLFSLYPPPPPPPDRALALILQKVELLLHFSSLSSVSVFVC